MRIMAIWSKSKPEVEFQYGERFCFSQMEQIISAMNRAISTKFGRRIDFTQDSDVNKYKTGSIIEPRRQPC